MLLNQCVTLLGRRYDNRARAAFNKRLPAQGTRALCLLALLACPGGQARGQSDKDVSGRASLNVPGQSSGQSSSSQSSGQTSSDPSPSGQTSSGRDKRGKKERDRDASRAYYGPKKRIAVMDMEIKVAATPSGGTTTAGTGASAGVDVAAPGDLGTGMTEMLTTALVHSERFVVLERKALPDVQAEQALGAAPSTDADSAAKPGRLLGAQTLVRGAVTEFATRKSSVGLGGIVGELTGSQGSAEAVVGIDIRLYDTETGQLLAAEHAQGRARSSGISLDFAHTGIKLGGSRFDSTPLGKAAREAIEKAVKIIIARMEARPWESRVADLDGEGATATLFLSAGSGEGLHVGDELDIWHPGDPILDPQTRLVIGHKKEARAGRCKIVQLTDTMATASVVEGSGFQKKDIARLPAPIVLTETPVRPPGQ